MDFSIVFPKVATWVKYYSSAEFEDGFSLLLSLDAGFSALLSPPLDFSLFVVRPCPEGER